ncbi:hypothetical protein [Bradyrhizobium sp. CCBAU 53380]|uniref:hypothetical protein n=1 Tax=Bradyrhizobium sp. CCBAU 53380 TaxID=1325117 RepID=UPI002FE364C3
MHLKDSRCAARKTFWCELGSSRAEECFAKNEIGGAGERAALLIEVSRDVSERHRLERAIHAAEAKGSLMPNRTSMDAR